MVSCGADANDKLLASKTIGTASPGGTDTRGSADSES